MKTKDVSTLEIKVAENGVIVMTKTNPGYAEGKSNTYVFNDTDDLFVFLAGYLVVVQEAK